MEIAEKTNASIAVPMKETISVRRSSVYRSKSSILERTVRVSIVIIRFPATKLAPARSINARNVSKSKSPFEKPTNFLTEIMCFCFKQLPFLE